MKALDAKTKEEGGAAARDHGTSNREREGRDNNHGRDRGGSSLRGRGRGYGPRNKRRG